ncbi:MAG: PspC domain-containing protein [Candidatus Acidiferrales bacterium]
MFCPKCQREIADYSSYCYFCVTRQARAAQAGVAPRRLHRSVLDSKIAGVCGGMGEYLDTDSTIVRLVWALITVFTGIVPGILVYLAAWLIMPLGPVFVQPVAPAPAPSTTQTPHV